MGYILQAIVLFTLISGMGCEDYGDESGAYDYDNDRPEENSELENHRALLIKLYGGKEEADEKFWSRRYDSLVRDNECGLDRAWAVDDVRLTVVSQERGSVLTEAEKKDLLLATENDIERLLNDSKMNYDRNCKDYFEDLTKSRSHLDCALGRDEITAYFAKLAPPKRCWDEQNNFSRGLWILVVNAPDFSQRCNETGVYNDIVRIAQISKGRSKSTSWGSARDIEGMRLMAELTKTLSLRHHLDYLTRITCGKDILPRNCRRVMNTVGSAVCVPNVFQTIQDVEVLVKGQPNINPLSSTQDMVVTMEILGDLTKIVEELSKNKMQAQNRMQTESTLASYLDLMDYAIGESSQHIWVEMPEDESREKLQRVLLNNEQYVGAMSSIFFNSLGTEKEDYVLEKESMELKMFRSPEENATDKIDFEFVEAKIETELSPEEVASGLNVYAIHYKSWAELLQKQGLKRKNSTGNRMKYFVGKGGIISLSARADEGKKSIPVSYKMNFDRVAADSSTGDSRICMSCEYLNVATGEWENSGCFVKEVKDDGVTCRCNHTTNFAAFMSPVPLDMALTDAQYQAKQIVSYIGSAVSVLALALSLIVFNIVRPTIRNDRLKAHMNLAFALFVVHAIQLTAEFALNVDVACLMAAVFTHFFLLASFFWMLIEGIFLYLYVVQVFIHSTVEYLHWVYILGWTIPAVIVAISAGVGIPTDTYLDVRESPCGEEEVLYPQDLREHKYETCWLSARSGMAWSFIAPALIIIFINTAILVKVLQVLMKVSGKSRNIHPFQSPSSSSNKEPSSGFVNKSYLPKGTYSPGKYKTSESNGAPVKPAKDVEANYGATTNGHSTGSKHATASPSRFDSRAPSQAYSHNRAQSARRSPGHENANGKHFLEDVKSAIKGAAVLLPLLGIPWIFGLWVRGSFAFMMIFVVLNSTQGLAIFVVYCLMNGEVKRALQRHLNRAKQRSQTGRMRTSSTSSMRSLNSRFVKTWRKKSASEQPSK